MRMTCALELDLYRKYARETVRLLGEGTRRAVIEGLDAGTQYARIHHTHKKRTGRLTGIELLWRLIRGDAKGADGEIVNSVPYAGFVEFGTGPHQIWPKIGQTFTGPPRRGQSRRDSGDIGTHRVALRWYVGGRPVFAKYVNHPGSRPYPFMYPASEVARETIIFETEHVTFVLAAAIWE